MLIGDVVGFKYYSKSWRSLAAKITEHFAGNSLISTSLPGALTAARNSKASTGSKTNGGMSGFKKYVFDEGKAKRVWKDSCKTVGVENDGE